MYINVARQAKSTAPVNPPQTAVKILLRIVFSSILFIWRCPSTADKLTGGVSAYKAPIRRVTRRAGPLEQFLRLAGIAASTPARTRTPINSFFTVS